MTKKSEFGKGLTYCLGLFLAHERQDWNEEGRKVEEIIGEKGAAELWFYAASDHLYELEVEQVKNKALKKRLLSFKKKCLHWGHGFSAPYPTKKDVLWSLNEAKELLFLIDKKELGVSVVEADWK